MENLLTGFVMKENEGYERKSCFSLLGTTNRIWNAVLFTGFALYKNLWMFHHYKLSVLQQQFSDICLEKELKTCEMLASPPLHGDTQITFPLHSLVLKSPSLILYTYTKLRTPVFSVKQCYAYLYCMCRQVMKEKPDSVSRKYNTNASTQMHCTVQWYML